MSDIVAAYQALDYSTARSTVHKTLQLIANSTTAQWDSNTRRKLVSLLLSDVACISSRSRLSQSDATAALLAVKVLGRQQDASIAVLDHLESLYRLILGKPNRYPVGAANEALRCVGNALLHHETGRKAWVDLGGGTFLLNDLQESLSNERLFLDTRLLFLITLRPTPFIPLSIERYELIGKLESALSTSFHAMKAQKLFGRDALIDSLKITFSIMTHYPRMGNANGSHGPTGESQGLIGDLWDNKFTILVPYLLQILAGLPSTSPPIQPPMTELLNVLINVPASLLYRPLETVAEPSGIPMITHKGTAFIEDSGKVDMLQRLYSLLEAALRYYIEYDPDDPKVRTRCREKGVVLDDLLIPLPIIITRLIKENDEARARMFQWVFPQDLDRSQPLEKRTDMLGAFIRMMASIHHPHLKVMTSEMLFCLCNQDAAELSAQIGYGNAAGFLYSKGIMTAPTPRHDALGNLLHPITGTNVPMEAGSSSRVVMTDEEKEREAERLFVLFDRLEETGISVNPVRKARQEGKF